MALNRTSGRTARVQYRKREPSLREQVYQFLRNEIRHGRISYDDRLLDHEIAANLNVSRMPVREALLQLTNEGYLEGTTRGFILTQFTPADIRNIFEVRLLLEPAAIAKACVHADPEGLDAMKFALQQIQETHELGDVIGNLQANWEFRESWLNMVPNPQLVETMSRLWDRADLARFLSLKDYEFRKATLDRTSDMFDAFVQKDTEKLLALMNDNLQLAGQEYQMRQRQIMSQRSAG